MIEADLTLRAQDKCAVAKIRAEIVRMSPRRLNLTFELFGGTGHIRRPRLPEPPASPLSSGTSFHLVARSKGHPDCYHMELAPSGHWMAWHIAGSGNPPKEAAHHIRLKGGWISGRRQHWSQPYKSSERYEDGKEYAWVEMSVDLESAVGLTLEAPWAIGIAAIIVENSGRRSFWSLDHACVGLGDLLRTHEGGIEFKAAKPKRTFG